MRGVGVDVIEFKKAYGTKVMRRHLQRFVSAMGKINAATKIRLHHYLWDLVISDPWFRMIGTMRMRRDDRELEGYLTAFISGTSPFKRAQVNLPRSQSKATLLSD